MATGNGQLTRRPIGLYVVLVILAAAGALDVHQVVFAALGRSHDPTLLTTEQFFTGALATASVIAVWRRSRRAWLLVLGWGAAVTLLLATLPVVLFLPAESRGGIYASAGGVLLIAGAMGAYVRRLLSQDLTSA